MQLLVHCDVIFFSEKETISLIWHCYLSNLQHHQEERHFLWTLFFSHSIATFHYGEQPKIKSDGSITRNGLRLHFRSKPRTKKTKQMRVTDLLKLIWQCSSADRCQFVGDVFVFQLPQNTPLYWWTESAAEGRGFLRGAGWGCRFNLIKSNKSSEWIQKDKRWHPPCRFTPCLLKEMWPTLTKPQHRPSGAHFPIGLHSGRTHVSSLLHKLGFVKKTKLMTFQM